jgi:hypothetical protein
VPFSEWIIETAFGPPTAPPARREDAPKAVQSSCSRIVVVGYFCRSCLAEWPSLIALDHNILGDTDRPTFRSRA